MTVSQKLNFWVKAIFFCTIILFRKISDEAGTAVIESRGVETD
jgi:hypothetical protein